MNQNLLMRKSTIVESKIKNESLIGGKTTYYHTLAMSNGDTGTCGVQNPQVLLVNSEITYQYLKQDNGEFKIKYLNAAAIDFNLRNGLKYEESQQASLPLETNKPVTNQSVSNNNNQEVKTPEETSYTLSNSEAPWKKKNKYGAKNTKEGPAESAGTNDGRKYGYAKHKDEFVGYAYGYAKDYVIARMKEFRTAQPTTIPENQLIEKEITLMNHVARFLFSNIAQVLENTDLTPEMLSFKLPELPGEKKVQPSTKKSPAKRK